MLPLTLPTHTPACILHHTEIIVKFVAIRMHTAHIVVDARDFFFFFLILLLRNPNVSSRCHFSFSEPACYSKDVLIFFFPVCNFSSPVIVEQCDDSVVLNVTAVWVSVLTNIPTKQSYFSGSHYNVCKCMNIWLCWALDKYKYSIHYILLPH